MRVINTNATPAKCELFHPAAASALRLCDPLLEHSKHINNQMQMTVRTVTMRCSHAPPVAMQALVFVVDDTIDTGLTIPNIKS